jgi:hypothetical protein
MRDIAVAASEQGHRLWRNNIGKLQDITGRWVTYGLAVGSSDLIGIRSDGRFLSVEVKAGRRKTTTEQAAWLSMIREMGGIAGVAHSVEEALALIRG